MRMRCATMKAPCWLSVIVACLLLVLANVRMPVEASIMTSRRTQPRLQLIVPLRDREFQVSHFTAGMLRHLEAQPNLHYDLIFVEQSAEGLFNRGALLNAGHAILQQQQLPPPPQPAWWSSPPPPPPPVRVCYHDIDYLPIDGAAFAPYLCTESYQVAVNATCKPDAPQFVASRALCVPADVVAKVGGWVDDYWGWGYEDADLDLQLLLAGEEVRRAPSVGAATHSCINAAGEAAAKRAVRWRKEEAQQANLLLHAVRKATAHTTTTTADEAEAVAAAAAARGERRAARTHVLSLRTLRDTTEVESGGGGSGNGRGSEASAAVLGRGRVLRALVSVVEGLHPALAASMAAMMEEQPSQHLPPFGIQRPLQRCLRGLGGCDERPLPPRLRKFLDGAATAFRRAAMAGNTSTVGAVRSARPMHDARLDRPRRNRRPLSRLSRVGAGHVTAKYVAAVGAAAAAAWEDLRVPPSLRKEPKTLFVALPHRVTAKQPRVLVTGLPRAATDWVALLASMPLAHKMGAAHNLSLEATLARKHFMSCRPGCIREPLNPHTRSLFELCDQAERLPAARRMPQLGQLSPVTSQYLMLDGDEQKQLTVGRWVDHLLQLCLEERRKQDNVPPSQQSLVIKDPNGFFAARWLAARYGDMAVVVMLRSPLAWLASMERAGWDQLDGCNRKSLPHCAKDVLLIQLAAARRKAPTRLLVPADAVPLLRAAVGWGRLARNALFLRIFFHACHHYAQERPTWRFYRQEDALARPVEFLWELYELIGVPRSAVNAQVVEAAFASTHSTGGKATTHRHASRRAFGSQPTAWRTELSPAAQAIAANLTRGVSSPWYGASHWWAARGAARGTRFTDVIEASGLPPQSTSFGVSFGDFDGDDRPDVLMGFHYTGLRQEHMAWEQPAVYVNEGRVGGVPTFRRVRLIDMPGVATRIERNCSGQCFVLKRSGDLHGAAWHDFDGDGDQDIFINTGAQGGMGTSPCLFLENDGHGGFVDRAAAFNLTLNEVRGRVSVWLDWDGDGLSDLLVTAQPGGVGAAGRSVLFRQTRDGGSAGAPGGTPRFALATTGTFGLARLYVRPGTDAPVAIVPEGRLVMPPPPAKGKAEGAASSERRGNGGGGDGGGDGGGGGGGGGVGGRGGVSGEGVFGAGGNGVAAAAAAARDAAWDAAATGRMRELQQLDVCLFYCREWYTHYTYCCAFASEVHGHDQTVMAVAAASTAAGTHTSAGKGTSSTQQPPPHAPPPLVDGMLNAQLEEAGLIWSVLDGGGAKQQQGKVFPTYAVLGDWDNDGDVDVFVVRFLEDRVGCLTGARTSPPNLLLENHGDGTLTLASGGAGDGDGDGEGDGDGGTWGAAVRRPFGNGDSAAAADVNGDGFLDLLVTHGAGIVYAPGTGRDAGRERREGSYDIKLHHYTRGPNQLLLNAGANGNHWLKVRLVGRRSEGGSIGARVTVRAAYTVQRRAKTSGGNLMSMSYHELHFGLGLFTECDEVTVEWPSGLAETRRAVAADKTLTMREVDATASPQHAPQQQQQQQGDTRTSGAAAHTELEAESGGASKASARLGHHRGGGEIGRASSPGSHFACSVKKNVRFDDGCVPLRLVPPTRPKEEL